MDNTIFFLSSNGNVFIIPAYADTEYLSVAAIVTLTPQLFPLKSRLYWQPSRFWWKYAAGFTSLRARGTHLFAQANTATMLSGLAKEAGAGGTCSHVIGGLGEFEPCESWSYIESSHTNLNRTRGHWASQAAPSEKTSHFIHCCLVTSHWEYTKLLSGLNTATRFRNRKNSHRRIV